MLLYYSISYYIIYYPILCYIILYYMILYYMIIYIYINCSKNSNRESTGGPYIPMALALMLGSGVFNPG